MDRDTFLKRKDRAKTSSVDLPDGGTLKFRKLTQAEVEHARKHYSSPDKGLAGLRYVVCRCALNDDGTPMFTDADLDGLAGMDFDDIDTVAKAIGKFSGTAAPNA